MLAMQKNIHKSTEAKILVVGLGKTGYSCAKFLSHQRNDFKMVDSRQSPPMLEQYLQQWSKESIALGQFDNTMLAGIETVMVSPGVSSKEPMIQEAIRRGLHVQSDIELFAHYAKAPIIAITGSNGKSTVTTLMGEMIRAAGFEVLVGGNLGTPALDLLSEKKPDFYVLEISSFHLDLTGYFPTAVSVVLNVSQDHMDRYASVEEYASSKRKIYSQATVGVFNKDDHIVLKMRDQIPRAIYFTEHEPSSGEFGLISYQNKAWLAEGDNRLIAVDDLRIKGKHNYINVLSCLALGKAIGLRMEAMLNAAKEFAGLPHRCQWVANIKGVDWFNDSKATNVGAAVAAITSMSNPIILIAGGDGKGADFTEFGNLVSRYARAVVLLGRDAKLIATVISPSVNLVFVKSIQDAVVAANQLAHAGDVVLLAPGCSSLDMFANYEERGDRYSTAVHQLAQEQQS